MGEMDAEERAALDAYLEGCCHCSAVDESTTRKAMGVLRRLWPEYYEQLKPRRGRKANNELRHLVISRFTMLTDRRMRDNNPGLTGSMRRPYTLSEAITKIARENHISEDYVRELTEATRAEQKAEQKQSMASQAKLKDDAKERELLVVLRRYELTLRQDFYYLKLNVESNSAFEKYLEEAHQKAARETAIQFGRKLEEIVLITKPVRNEIVEEFSRKRAAHLLKAKIGH